MWRWHKHRAELTIMVLVHSHIYGGFWMCISHLLLVCTYLRMQVVMNEITKVSWTWRILRMKWLWMTHHTTLPVMWIIFSYSMFATWNTSNRHCKMQCSVLLLVWIWFEAVDSIWWLRIQKFFILVKIITTVHEVASCMLYSLHAHNVHLSSNAKNHQHSTQVNTITHTFPYVNANTHTHIFQLQHQILWLLY